jgi:hypothetical protein
VSDGIVRTIEDRNIGPHSEMSVGRADLVRALRRMNRGEQGRRAVTGSGLLTAQLNLTPFMLVRERGCVLNRPYPLQALRERE